MIKFIENIGDFFSSNYFDEDFVKKVHDKSGYSSDDYKGLQKRISPLKDKYFKYKHVSKNNHRKYVNSHQHSASYQWDNG